MEKFNLDLYMQPFWEGNSVVNETFLPYKIDEDMEMFLEVPLLYRADEIEYISNYELTQIYKEGEDYFLKDGKIIIPYDSKISPMLKSVMNPATIPNDGLNAKCATGGYLLYTEGDFIVKKQCVISYKHTDKWSGYKPNGQINKLPKIKRNLQQGGAISLVVYGDSITVGCNSSGFMNMSPFMPTWPDMVVQALKCKYGAEITCTNCAVGGTTSSWGLDNFDNVFKNINADLFFVNFGMNDGVNVSVDTYIRNIKGIIEKILCKNKYAEVVLVASTFPNPLAMGIECYKDRYPYLFKLADEFDDSVAVAPLTPIHEYILTKKRYFDMTANNINHPNDMMCRIYAQTVFDVLHI